MSGWLSFVAYFTRVEDHGDYYVIEYYDDKFIVRKNRIERDIARIVNAIPCVYARELLRVLAMRISFNREVVEKSMRC
jgi:hypothetical protein